ncbi:hypothetical protein [Mesorhizobium sp. B2-3-4]|uniref:hypothetical protein n=1 Tax=Mesorhizobium sp. B2-3-4 TaxID=2589959 RepID=UPI00112974F0|nr:hypothetical protein [Mesorhizobium sp. B2-3-4]TPM26863.1 hypothetical protein FJ967_31225 [Mesorhizobium sp. B2-3-4]
MRKLILASLVAMAATASVIAPTQAASVTIQSDDGNQYSDDDSGIVVRRHHDRRYDNRYDGDQNVQYDNDGEYRRHHRHHRCHTETVVHWRHHHKVIEDVRICG